MGRAHPEIPEAKGMVVVEAVHGIELLKDVGEDAAKGEKAQDHHAHEGGNPHVWLDPVLVQGICRRIAEAFIRVDPDHRGVYEAGLQQYVEQLEALDREIRSRVATFRIRDYVSFHPAFIYFARRYNLHEVGVIEAAPGREPTPRHLQLVAAIRRYGIRVVFAEPQLNPRVAEVIAQEAGVKVLMLDPIGGPPPYGSDYLKMMRVQPGGAG